MIFAFDNDKGRDRLASRINTIDRRCLLAIARLLRFCLATLLRARNNYCSRDNAYLKLGLIKVVDICLLDTVLCDYIPYKCKLATNNI